MTKDKSIFSLRFGSDAELYPTQEELDLFLRSPKKKGGREPHDSDLATYGELLEAVQEFKHQQQGTAQDLKEKMFYGVLDQSQFFNPALKLAVEHYKYHVHAFLTLDFRKPTAFIKSAEEEMGRLNPKKQEDAAKLARLRDMADERKKTLETLEGRRAALVRELENLALYIRDNLVKIEKLCEASIVVLVDLHLSQNEENRLIEDIKTQFKDQLRDSLHQGPVSKQHLETVKQDVAILSHEISVLLREDVYALTRLYEAVHDHTKKIVLEINALMAEIGSKKGSRVEDEGELFSNIEKVLVSLTSEFHFDLRMTGIRSETAHENILIEKRGEMLDHVFELLQKERRARNDRRSSEDRRKSNEQNDEGQERRGGKDRRSGKNRRE